MVLTILVALIVCKIFAKENLSKFYIGYYSTLTFCYKNVARTSFSLINCKNMNDISFLYINGEVECFTKWQIATVLFLVLWVAPFPLAVSYGYRMLKTKKIPFWVFVMFLTFPFFSVFMALSIRNKKRNIVRLTQETDSRLIEIFEEPYKEKFYWWEAWRLTERFIVSGFAVFMTNPIDRILYLTPIFLIFAYFHFRINPYKRSMYILKRLDSVAWFCLFGNLGINGMRAIVYMYDVPNVAKINNTLHVANIFEQLFSPLWYLIISLIAKKVYDYFF